MSEAHWSSEVHTSNQWNVHSNGLDRTSTAINRKKQACDGSPGSLTCINMMMVSVNASASLGSCCGALPPMMIACASAVPARRRLSRLAGLPFSCLKPTFASRPPFSGNPCPSAMRFLQVSDRSLRLLFNVSHRRKVLGHSVLTHEELLFGFAQ